MLTQAHHETSSLSQGTVLLRPTVHIYTFKQNLITEIMHPGQQLLISKDTLGHPLSLTTVDISLVKELTNTTYITVNKPIKDN